MFVDPGLSHHDSGFLHRAPNSSRSGKGIVRRPTVPLTSVPEQTNVISQPREIPDKSIDSMLSERPSKRPSIAVRTTSLVPDPNGGPNVPMASTPKAKFDPMQAFRNSFLGKTAENDEVSGSVPRWKGKDKALPTREDSMERMRQGKLSSKAIEIRAWLQGKSGSAMHRTPLEGRTGNGNAALSPLDSITKQPKKGTIRNLFKNNRPALPPKDRGPKPGQTYEIVDRRVVENNPERTVEISTWREQPVQRRTANDDDVVSIYFLSADEYPQDGEYANTTMAKVEWKVDAPDFFPEHSSRKGSVRSGRKQRSDGSLAQNLQGKTPSLTRQRSASIRETMSPAQQERTISPSPIEKVKSHPVQVTVEEIDHTAGSSSTPVRNPAPRNASRQRGRYKESPADKERLRSPQRPTRSTSTISRIKSDSSIQFEGLLQSCQPSLYHIAPMLQNLGIRNLEHLKAVGKLTPIIRDREIKEDALRLGITIVEWAILLDKASAL